MSEKPLDKEKKYDRQLRLWGQAGQSAVENAHICLLNAGPCGTETMKNLVLPGIGKFTIVDGKNVSKRDLGNNFFVDVASVGKSRAEVTAKLLHELNDFVKEAHAIVKNPEDLIKANPDFVKDYTLILATEITQTSLLALGASCFKHNVPLVVVQANGLLGFVRLQVHEHTVIESKPDFPPVDLRLGAPFPGLQAFADSFVLASLDSGEHSHVPFPVLLIKALADWKQNHNGQVPTDSESRDLFKEAVLQMARKDEENFTEAYMKAHLAYQESSIPDEVKAVLNDDKAKNLTAKSDKFWFLAHAVSAFVSAEGKGKLPLMGSIPDMHSSTDKFIALQHVYRDQAAQDAKSVRGHLNKALSAAGLPLTHVTDEDVALFCKHSLFLRLYRFRPIAAEFGTEGLLFAENLPLMDFQTMQYGDGKWYAAQRAAWRFQAKHGRFPGENVAKPEDDFSDLRTIGNELVKDLGLDEDALEDEYLKEISRFGNSQIHTTGALLGGMAAQEIIKLLTHQWTPMNNTYVFNGIRSTGAVFEV